MGKKKPFVDKKKSATFQILARDTSGSAAAGGDPASDRVFVRVDSNPYSVPGLEDDEEVNDGELNEEDGPNSIFADAPDDTDDEKDAVFGDAGAGVSGASSGELPDQVRREIIELGLPDDGYNYLFHLREIRNTGGGSAYYHNSKAQLDRLPLDVKAFDASRLRIGSDVSSELKNDSNSFYNVASKTVGVKVQRAVDPDVARLLDDSDLSRFGSDVEDLDEDFVVKANLPDREEEDEVFVIGREVTRLEGDSFLKKNDKFFDCKEGSELEVCEKPRIQRLLDEQFDLLTLQEYNDDGSDDDDGDNMGTNDEPLAAKLGDALKPYGVNNLEQEHKYRVPGDLEHGHLGCAGEKDDGSDDDDGDNMGTNDEPLAAKLGDALKPYVLNNLELDHKYRVPGDLSSDVIQKVVEYAEKYCKESDDDKEVVLVEESSDESEVWDCETIVSTYSNLDNHPGKIQAPGNPKKLMPKIFYGDPIAKDNVITLGGKEKLPVQFLPQNKRAVEKVKAAVKASNTDMQKGRPHEESKEEKKERKAAVKEERRQARRVKKELKGLYKCEAQKAQHVAATAGPSSIQLM